MSIATGTRVGSFWHDRRMQIGFIGVGQMGRPMVDRMVAAGHSVSAYVRRPELGDELAGRGVTIRDSAVTLAAASDVLIVCLFSDVQQRRVLIDGGVAAAMQPGSVLVTHVTGSPRFSEELVAAVTDGVSVLDAPMSGTSDQIRAGTLAVLVGGDETALDRVRSILSSYSNPITHVGHLGDAQKIKLVNNLLFTVNLNAAVEAMRLAASMGIESGDLARVLRHTSGGSFVSNLMEHVPPESMMAAAKPYLVKDVAAVRAAAADIGLELGPLGDLASWVDHD